MKRYDIENLQPTEVFSWFKKICAIPHGSYHEQAISDWLTKTCKELGADATQYPSGMILARLNATKGCENKPIILLQSHIDMVLAKTKQCKKDLLVDPITPYYDDQDGCIHAEETSLGADDGIGVAAMLAILADKNIAHGPLEFLFTTNEEDRPGICCNDLKPNDIKAQLYFSLDGESPKKIWGGAAGNNCATFDNEIKYVKCNEKTTLNIYISNARGGHSGVHIHLPHINVIIWLAETILRFKNKFNADINLINFNGGPANNAIPTFVEANIQIDSKLIDEFKNFAQTELDLVKKMVQGFDSKITIDYNTTNHFEEMVNDYDTTRVLTSIACARNGMFIPEKTYQYMFCSNNIGLVTVNEKTKKFRIDFKVRSFLDKDVDRNIDNSILYMAALGFNNYSVNGRCTSFFSDLATNKSALVWAEAVKTVMGEDAVSVMCPAGLELADICKAAPQLAPNAICVGASVMNEHCPDECIIVKDVQSFLNVLKEALKMVK